MLSPLHMLSPFDKSELRERDNHGVQLSSY